MNLKKKGMMMSMYAGPFFGGLVIGLIIGAVVLWLLFSKGVLTCPALPPID